MNSEEYHIQLRVLLHDTADNYSVDETVYLEEELTRVSLECRNRVFQACVDQSDAFRMLVGLGIDPNRSKSIASRSRHLTVYRRVQNNAATSGTDIPANFWKLIVGRKASGLWVNVEPLKIAEALVDEGLDAVFVKAGKFYGTASLAYYWAYPTSSMAPRIQPFSDFSDSFYHAVMSLAAFELIMKESSNTASRLESLRDLFVRQFESLP